MPVLGSGNKGGAKPHKHHFHHWAAGGSKHRKDDAAWPEEGRDLIILRLHKSREQYGTRLKASDKQRGLLVIKSAARRDGTNIKGKPGDRMMLAWLDEFGEHVIPVAIAKVVPEEPPAWVLKQIGIPITKQLRRFARIRDVSPADISQGTNFIEAMRLDISEGGMKIKIPSHIDYEQGEEVTVKTKVGLKGNQREIAGKATVMKVFHRSGSKEIGVSFIDLPESDKDFIRRYIYERQIKERRLRHGGADD